MVLPATACQYRTQISLASTGIKAATWYVRRQLGRVTWHPRVPVILLYAHQLKRRLTAPPPVPVKVCRRASTPLQVCHTRCDDSCGASDACLATKYTAQYNKIHWLTHSAEPARFEWCCVVWHLEMVSTASKQELAGVGPQLCRKCCGFVQSNGTLAAHDKHDRPGPATEFRS
jgi:hypothetical protein